ncbi:hypothetical protein PILCRDRAFT_15946 [Piloderma croceum F 1598]|uniref:Uncharacterized protein n=1 Tax=Piloderma croceum (strain F 1598) TaxID=765440 RepID=A0A0C3B5U6_PILCF|nr:hypothetical protein PILCRDRAFT_15946 [Piloderma croceum F 1598]
MSGIPEDVGPPIDTSSSTFNFVSGNQINYYIHQQVFIDERNVDQRRHDLLIISAMLIVTVVLTLMFVWLLRGV